jgi:Phospholipase_D-nuclease N-terminal
MESMTVLAVTPFVWVFIVVPLLIVWAIGVVDIVRRKDLETGPRVGWIILVILLPFVGTLVYWFLRKPSEQEIEQAQQVAAEPPEGWQDPHQRPPVS